MAHPVTHSHPLNNMPDKPEVNIKQSSSCDTQTRPSSIIQCGGTKGWPFISWIHNMDILYLINSGGMWSRLCDFISLCISPIYHHCSWGNILVFQTMLKTQLYSTSGRCGCNFKGMFHKRISWIDILTTSNEIHLWWVPENPMITSQHWFRQ